MKLGLKYFESVSGGANLPVINNGEWNKPSNFPTDLGKVLTCEGIMSNDGNSKGVAFKYIPEGLLLCVGKRASLRGKVTNNVQAFWIFIPSLADISSKEIVDVIGKVEEMFNDPLIFSNGEKFISSVPADFKREFAVSNEKEGYSGDMSGLKLAVIECHAPITLELILDYGFQQGFSGYGMIAINQFGKNHTPVDVLNIDNFVKPQLKKEEIQKEEKIEESPDYQTLPPPLPPLPLEPQEDSALQETPGFEAPSPQSELTNTSTGYPNHSAEQSQNVNNPSNMGAPWGQGSPNNYAPFDPQYNLPNNNNSKNKNIIIIALVIGLLIMGGILAYLLIPNSADKTKRWEDDTFDPTPTIEVVEEPYDEDHASGGSHSGRSQNGYSFPPGISYWKGEVNTPSGIFDITLRTTYLNGDFHNTVYTNPRYGTKMNLQGRIFSDGSIVFNGSESKTVIYMNLDMTGRDKMEGLYEVETPKQNVSYYVSFTKTSGNSSSTTYQSNSASYSSGVINLTGKIDGKYPVHMTINLSTGNGSYYYDKYGSSNKMTLLVTENSSGNLKINEYNSDGQYCGEWRGRISNGVYSGCGTFMGGEMPFSLKVN